MVNAPIVPVSLDFRNADGSPRFVRVVNGRAITCGTPIEPGCNRLFFDFDSAGSGGTTFLQRILDSPVFSSSNYTSSSTPTQFADAVQRAEFQGAQDNWHTLLVPSVKTARTMVINQDPTCGIGRGLRGHCSYLYALNPDGRCCFFVLLDVNVFVNGLFPPTFQFPPPSTTVAGAAEAAGDITTTDVPTFCFPPAYLFIPVNHARPCCIGGFHSFDVEAGDNSNGNLLRAFVLNYSTWDQPIFLDRTVLDVTGLSHEISETYNDPSCRRLWARHHSLVARSQAIARITSRSATSSRGCRARCSPSPCPTNSLITRRARRCCSGSSFSRPRPRSTGRIATPTSRL